MQRTRATRSHAASLPASPSGSAFQTGSAASSPLQRSATTATGAQAEYGTSTPMPLSAVPSAATLSGQLSGRSSPRGWNASRGVDARQTEQLDADDERDETGAMTTRSDKGKGAARETALSSAAGGEAITGGHAHPATAPQNDDDDDEAQRKRQIERVLKRAQAAKVRSSGAPAPKSVIRSLTDPSSEKISSRATFGIESSSPRSRTREAGKTSNST